MDFFDLKAQVYAAPAFKTRQQMWHECIERIGAGDTALEFGVWQGTSINYMANARPDSAFHGFDSFDGLPEDWIRNNPKGTFRVADRAKLKFAPNVTVHDGMFDDTIPRFVRTTQLDRLAFIHVDCDLGRSCDTVLSNLAEAINATKPLILFDEFYNYLGFEDHEFLSFLNFINSTGTEFKVVGRNINHWQAMVQIL